MYKSLKQRIPFAAILLAVLIAFQSLGWLLAWKGLQFGAKIEARKTLLEHGSTLIEKTFHKDFIQKVKVGRKEILLEGQLFDYQRVSDSGDSITIKLYHDQKEQALLALLGQVFKSEEDGNSLASLPLGLWLAKWLSVVFLSNEKPVLELHPAPNSPKQNFSFLFFWPQAVLSVFTPPPEGLG